MFLRSRRLSRGVIDQEPLRLSCAEEEAGLLGLVVGAYPGASAKPASDDGVFTGATIAIQFAGTSYLLRGDTAKVTLSGGRTKGSFSASGLPGSGSGTGGFAR